LLRSACGAFAGGDGAVFGGGGSTSFHMMDSCNEGTRDADNCDGSPILVCNYH